MPTRVNFDRSRFHRQYSELSNLVTHLNLASLRPAGTKTRQIPRGYGFDSVSCANYWFESLAWFAFTGLTLNWAGTFSKSVVFFPAIQSTERAHDPCELSTLGISWIVHGRRGRTNVRLGRQEAQEVQERVRRQVPAWQESHVPLHRMIATTRTAREGEKEKKG